MVDYTSVDMTKLALTMPDSAGVLLSISSLLSLLAEEGMEGEEKDEAYHDNDVFDEHITDYAAVDVLIVCECGSMRSRLCKRKPSLQRVEAESVRRSQVCNERSRICKKKPSLQRVEAESAK